MAKRVNSVGYHFTLTNEIMNLIRDKTHTELFNNTSPYEIFVCVWYHDAQYRGISYGCKTQSGLRDWFSTKSKKDMNGFLRQVYVTKKVVVGSFDCEGDRFLAVFVDNTNRMNPSQVKQSCNSGQFGQPNDLGRVTVHLTPYMTEE